MRNLKNAINSYEDERFVYLLLTKSEMVPEGQNRVIKRPNIMKGNVLLTLCSKEGQKQVRFAKSDGEEYKHAKKAKINDILK